MAAEEAVDLSDPTVWPRLLSRVATHEVLAVIGRWLDGELRQHVNAEDIWQETLLHAWRDRSHCVWEGMPAFRGWLLSIARHRVSDKRREVKAWKAGGKATTLRFSALADMSPEEHASASQVLAACTPGPSSQAATRELAHKIQQALAMLDADDARLVQERLLEGRSLTAIAADLGMPLSTAKYRLHRACEDYQQRLKELGAAPSSSGNQVRES